jgi:hypothetical protein
MFAGYIESIRQGGKSMKPILSRLCAAAALLACGQVLKANSDGVVTAIIGDSISTGAASHPAHQFGDEALTEVFLGKVPLTPDEATGKALSEGGFTFHGLLSPTRVAPTLREFKGPGSWAFHNAMWQFSRSFLDVEEFAWGYLAGRELGAEPHKVLIAADDGARAMAGVRQAQRILLATGGTLPHHTFVFFTGNDLCAVDLTQVTPAKDYGAAILGTLQELVKRGKASPAGSKIWVVNPMSSLQLVRSPAILNRKTIAHGKETTCRDLFAQGASGYARLSSPFPFIPRGPAELCPTLIQNARLDVEAQNFLANRLAEYRRHITTAVEKAQAKAPVGVRIQQLRATDEWLLAGDDVANDCFHLSLTGQMRLAQIVLTEMSPAHSPQH